MKFRMLLIWKTSLQEHMTLITSGLGLCLGNFNWKAWLFSGRFLYLFLGFFSHQSHGFDLPFRPLFSDLQVLLSNQMLYLLVNAIHHSYSQKVYLLKNWKNKQTEKNQLLFLYLKCVSYRRPCAVSWTASPSPQRWKAAQVQMKAVLSYGTCKKNALSLCSPVLERQS